MARINRPHRPTVTFTPFGARTPDCDTESEILVGANYGVAERVGWIERHIEWEKVGGSRKYTAVAGGTTFTVEAFDGHPELAELEGSTFRTLKDVRNAVLEKLT